MSGVNITREYIGNKRSLSEVSVGDAYSSGLAPASKKQRINPTTQNTTNPTPNIRPINDTFLKYLVQSSGVCKQCPNSDWSLEFLHFPYLKKSCDTDGPKESADSTKENATPHVSESYHASHKCLDLLFNEKLLDWNDFLEHEHRSNNFICIVKDALAVWRGGVTFSISMFKEKTLLVRIPLLGIDLHYRRQKLGTILIYFLMQQFIALSNDYFGSEYHVEFIVLAINDKEAIEFWKKNSFGKECQDSSLMENLSKEKLLKSGFMKDIESDLLPLFYNGPKHDAILHNLKCFKEFVSPKYMNFGKKYCKRDEIESLTKELERRKQMEENGDDQIEAEEEEEEDGDYHVESDTDADEEEEEDASESDLELEDDDVL